MTVREAQFEALRAVADDEFIVRLKNLLVKSLNLKPEFISLEAIKATVARGRMYGLGWQSSLGVFALLSFVIGPKFDELPRFQSILRDRDVDVEDRMVKLVATAEEEDWELAAKLQ